MDRPLVPKEGHGYILYLNLHPSLNINQDAFTDLVYVGDEWCLLNNIEKGSIIAYRESLFDGWSLVEGIACVKGIGFRSLLEEYETVDPDMVKEMVEDIIRAETEKGVTIEDRVRRILPDDGKAHLIRIVAYEDDMHRERYGYNCLFKWDGKKKKRILVHPEPRTIDMYSNWFVLNGNKFGPVVGPVRVWAFKDESYMEQFEPKPPYEPLLIVDVTDILYLTP